MNLDQLRRNAKYINIDKIGNAWYFITVYNEFFDVLEKMEYLYYTKREAIKKFREDFNLKYKKLKQRY